MNNLNENFRPLRLRPAFINRETLATVAAEAIAKLEKTDIQDAKRWINAIAKAVVQIENNPSMTYDFSAKHLQVTGTQGKTYNANGVCQCQAYDKGFPCWHRAASRLIVRYLETVQ